MARTVHCDALTRKGRLGKAEQFYAAAELLARHEKGQMVYPDAYVDLCIKAGIAAADVICGARLGEYSSGESHSEAVALLRSVDRESSTLLDRLLRTKSRAEYQAESVSDDTVKRAGRQARGLLAAARNAEVSARQA